MVWPPRPPRRKNRRTYRIVKDRVALGGYAAALTLGYVVGRVQRPAVGSLTDKKNGFLTCPILFNFPKGPDETTARCSVCDRLSRSCPAQDALHKTASAAQPLTSGIDQANFDKTVRPQDDLFRAVNGAWLAKTEIPADRSDYGAFGGPGGKGREGPPRDHRGLCQCQGQCRPARKARRWATCIAPTWMKPGPSNSASSPSPASSRQIDGIRTKADLMRVLAEFAGLAYPARWAATSRPTPRSPIGTSSICPRPASACRTATTTGMPSTRRSSRPTAGTSSGMLTLAKVADAKQARPPTIVALETQTGQGPVVEGGKPRRQQDLQQDDPRRAGQARARLRLAPVLQHDRREGRRGAHRRAAVVLHGHGGNCWISVPLATWKVWLKWKWSASYASLLNKEMVDADFAFYGTVLRGIPKNRPRWKRAVGAVEGSLGEAVGKLYVEKAVPARGQGPHGPDGQERHGGLSPEHPEP